MAISLYKGGDFVLAMAVSQRGSSVALDLTGYTFEVFRSNFPAAPTVEIVSAVGGGVKISLASALTLALTEGRNYQLYLVMIDPLGRRIALAPITVQVK